MEGRNGRTDDGREEGRRAGTLELSAETQMEIIEKTGILHRAAIPNRKPPLIQFSTHELNAFKNTLQKPNGINDDDDDEQEEEEEEEGQNNRPPPDHIDTLRDDVDSLPLWVDRAFDTFLWSIPFTTVFVCFAVFLLHYTLHYHHHLLATLLLFGLSAIGGSYMIYIMNKLSYLLVMRRVPPLGALWIFAVVRLHLSHALLSLLLVALWVWIMDLSLYV
ncbi:hypothetical protein VP01_668g6 [Puccinia sorghi]|uniref:DUF7719 domain-containing protein n=1 Tax=Puccinia sorghi TaxID=27349 RepID=A0A0L6UEZ5_9BASI|nr:hypothetical protein VP01_668g6 [Puccinia sorghi]